MLTRCLYCNHDAIMPKSQLCLVCNNFAKVGGKRAYDKQRQDLFLINNHSDNNNPPYFQQTELIDDLFCIDNSMQFKKNSRVATRFIRKDIAARIHVSGLLRLGKTIPVDLMDISSKGALIATRQKLGINKKITLTLQFKLGRIFIINALVVRRSSSSSNEYGIKFDHYNNELGDYLFETQEKLIFK